MTSTCISVMEMQVFYRKREKFEEFFTLFLESFVDIMGGWFLCFFDNGVDGVGSCYGVDGGSTDFVAWFFLFL